MQRGGNEKICESCGFTGGGDGKKLLCGGCLTSYFCSTSCQLSSWKLHKKICRQRKNSVIKIQSNWRGWYARRKIMLNDGRDRCEVCGVTNSKEKQLHLCNGCKMSFYCSITCQQYGWKRHKKICRDRQAIPLAASKIQYVWRSWVECKRARRKRDILRNNRERLNAVLKIQSAWTRSCTVEIRKKRHARKCRLVYALLLGTFIPFCFVVYLGGLFGVADVATVVYLGGLISATTERTRTFTDLTNLKLLPIWFYLIVGSIRAGDYILDIFMRLVGGRRLTLSSLERDWYRANVAIVAKSKSMRYLERMKKKDVPRRSKTQKFHKEKNAKRNIGIIQSMRLLRLNCKATEFESVLFLLYSFWDEMLLLTEFDGAVDSWKVQHMGNAILYFCACFSLLHNSESSMAIVSFFYQMIYLLTGKAYFLTMVVQLYPPNWIRKRKMWKHQSKHKRMQEIISIYAKSANEKVRKSVASSVVPFIQLVQVRKL